MEISRKYNILGKLPLEIGQQIAQHLELYQVYGSPQVAAGCPCIPQSHISLISFYELTKTSHHTVWYHDEWVWRDMDHSPR